MKLYKIIYNKQTKNIYKIIIIIIKISLLIVN